MHKVVFHINELNKWPVILNNTRNTAEYYNKHKESFYIILLANSEAVQILADHENDITKQITALLETGIAVLAYNNSLQGYSIPANKLPGKAGVVPSGVVELIKLQSEGYAYIKP